MDDTRTGARLIKGMAWGGSIGGAAGVGLGVVAGSVTGPGWVAMAGWLVLGPAMGASFGAVAGFVWAIARPETARAPCPHCGYDTHGLPRAAPTGEATCPECGGAVPQPEPEPEGDAGSGLP